MTDTDSPHIASIVTKVGDAYARIQQVDRPEVWIELRDEASVTAEAATIQSRLEAGEVLRLAGMLVAIKDNIDVLGLPTTAGSPEFSYEPTRNSSAVERLIQAGAIILGKTNLDQFATGLVGTRSPFGAVRNAANPLLISGGSSSGSATAVALGIVDIALGTDTAGSGRIPAALNGLVGIKPTLGLIPSTGSVPASRSYDTISVFARDLPTASLAFKVLVGVDGDDPLARAWPLNVRLAAPPMLTIGVPDADGLVALTPEARVAFADAVARLEDLGATITAVDIEPLLKTALLLYDGALVAERYAAVGAFLDTEPASADPSVSAIIRAAASIPAHQLVADREKVDRAKLELPKLLAGIDALMLPTAPMHPSLAEVDASPIAVNRAMGTFTNFVNLLDLAAVSVPAGRADDSTFGVTFITRAFEDQVGLDIAARFTDEAETFVVDTGIELAVFGAHLRGEPLNPQLVAAGARFIADITTDDGYALFGLATTPPKPGLVRVGAGNGVSIAGELWQLSAAELGSFLAALPAPMMLGSVVLADGREVIGFGCRQDALIGAEDLSAFGGWRAARAQK